MQGHCDKYGTVTDEKLHVVVVINNPKQFKRRYQLYEEFRKHMAQFKDHVEVYTVECAFAQRPSVVTDPEDSHHLILRSNQELWHKENMINLGVQRLLPQSWKYMAWIDADVEFTNRNWAVDAIHSLQHHPIVQLWQTACDFGPTGETMNYWSSFGWLYQKGQDPKVRRNGYHYMHPGYAWAMTRDAWDTTGGLIDWAVLGSGDYHQVMCWVGCGELSVDKGANANYKLALNAYQERCAPLNQDIGYVNGTILHYWHGKKADRQYNTRWQYLIKHQYDPLADLYHDSMGLIALTPHKPKLRQDIARYFRERNEDSVDL